MKEKFEIIKVAKISQGELAALAGVSRLMINRYAQGKSIPGKYSVGRTIRALGIIDALVAKGKLPMAEGIDREKRAANLLKIKAYVDQTV